MIEFWRGVPLITVLFMSSVMFPMFLPEDMFIDKLVRVIIAISLFEAAYVAEVIRGGLQALPRGQYDAAKSLGMGYWKMHILVILPQALKLVIPGITSLSAWGKITRICIFQYPIPKDLAASY